MYMYIYIYTYISFNGTPIIIIILYTSYKLSEPLWILSWKPCRFYRSLKGTLEGSSRVVSGLWSSGSL